MRIGNAIRTFARRAFSSVKKALKPASSSRVNADVNRTKLTAAGRYSSYQGRMG